MATVIFTQPQNMFAPYVWYGDVIAYDAGHITLGNGYSYATYYGSFYYNSYGLAGGTVRSYQQFVGGNLDYTVNDANASALTVEAYLDAGNAQGLQQYVLQYNDTIQGSPYADGIRGYNGNDRLFGQGGDDVIVGDAGNDIIIGGSGFDTAWFYGSQADYTIMLSPYGYAAVAYQPRGADGLDVLADIEQLGFSNGLGALKATCTPLEYIASYSDLLRAFGENPQAGFEHFVMHGYNEGRNISFDGLEYIASNADLILAFGANDDAGSVHFINHGYWEGRGPGSFDGLQYIASHGDLIIALGANRDAGSGHFINHGYLEGRDTDDFDAGQYLANYADLRAMYGTDLDAATVHYITYGFYEGRVDDVLA